MAVDVPQLQHGFEVFANWQTVLFCLAIYLIMQFIRSFVENDPATSTFAQGWVWQTMIKPFGPVVIGMGLILVCRRFPWPMPFVDVMSAKLMYGAVCGLVCGWMFARVRDWFGIAADSDSPFAQRVGGLVISRSVATPPPPSAAFGPKKASLPPPPEMP